MLWLTQRQLKSKEPGVRRKAVAQLCQTPSARALGALREALGDADVEVRRLAATALGKLEDERRVPPLLEALRDRDAEVVKAAVLALKGAENEAVVTALASLLRQPDAGVRGQAAAALEHRGWTASRQEDEIWFLVAKGQFARAVPFGAAALPALEAAAGSSPSSLAAGALEALGQLGDSRMLRPLVRAAKSADPVVAVAAVDALCRLGTAETIEPLVGALAHKHGRVRTAAVEALGRLRSRAAVERLGPLLADPVWEVRRETAEALGRIGDARAVSALSAGLLDQDDDVRETTALALGNLGDRQAIHSLVLSLKDTNSGVRRIAAAALARIDPHWNTSPEAGAAVEELKSALQEGDTNVRHFVGQLLVNLGAMEPDDAPGADPEAELAASPAKRRKLAVTLFAAILCDSDRDLRQAAAEALGHLNDPRAQSALLRAKGDVDAGVRAAVQASLQLLSPA